MTGRTLPRAVRSSTASTPNPPSTEQILRMFEERQNNDLIEILRSVQDVFGQNGNQPGHHSKLSDFQRTKPPSFSQVIDPLEAYDWLWTIERKLESARTEEGAKVPFATHYLEGAAAIWWENIKAMWPADEEITSSKFTDQFRKYNIPTKLWRLSRKNFSRASKEIGPWVNICKNSIICHVTPFMTWPLKKERLTDLLVG